MKNTILITILITSFSAFARSSNSRSPIAAETRDHLTIASVEVSDLTDYFPAPSFFEVSLMNNQNGDDGLLGKLNKAGATLDATDVIADKIINIGTKIWNVVEKGKPVANYNRQTANALPEKVQSWDQLQNWKAPTSKVISVVYKNLFGVEVVKFVYRIVLLYGGNIGGTGHYIGYASVEPLEMTTAYLYTFNANVKIESVYNLGTSSNPIAGMLLNVNWTISTLLKTSTESHTYTLDGLGKIRLPTVSNSTRLQ